MLRLQLMTYCVDYVLNKLLYNIGVICCSEMKNRPGGGFLWLRFLTLPVL